MSKKKRLIFIYASKRVYVFLYSFVFLIYLLVLRCNAVYRVANE